MARVMMSSRSFSSIGDETGMIHSSSQAKDFAGISDQDGKLQGQQRSQSIQADKSGERYQKNIYNINGSSQEGMVNQQNKKIQYRRQGEPVKIAEKDQNLSTTQSYLNRPMRSFSKTELKTLFEKIMPVGLVAKSKKTARGVADKIANSKLAKKIKKLSKKKKSDRDRLTEKTIKLKGGNKKIRNKKKSLKRKQHQH